MRQVVSFDLNHPNVVIFNLTEANEELQQLDLEDTEAFTEYIFAKLREQQTMVGIGRYNEDRAIYRRSALFGNVRSIHLGIDIWAPPGSPVFTPLPGSVHSFQNNVGFGDYGPTIILEHEIEGVTFYTLYGHLSTGSIARLQVGQFFEAGERIGYLGHMQENGNWPPHLHFQIITDMQGRRGDFPGVATREEREYYLQICPNPNLILQIPALEQEPMQAVTP